ncbi:MAG TPA: hypothetical protein VMB85_01205 [Bryobacteraceae bacterium]|jgi:hypothetical protein|nr:hypothetical protein [Bryobacteraceae bacterium]
MAAHDHPVGHITGHETKDASVRLVVVVLAFLAAGAVCVGILVYGIFVYLADHPLSTAPPNPMAQTVQQQVPPEPRLQLHAPTDLQEFRAGEDKLLTTYGWTNKSDGIVRIPIDQAMNLALQRGFATKAANQSKAVPK